jgi:prephenate dehydrogenase
MKLFKRIAIVGTGLIGASLAMAIKEKKLADEVIGVSRHKKNLNLAKRNRIIDKGSQDICIIAQADFVVLATPVKTILKLADKISGIVKKDCIVTDVGSTKQEIASKLGRLFTNYVGAHPLAGSEKRSITHARADIFKDSLCILTPTHSTNPAALKKVKDFWAQLGAKTVFLSPVQHDRILAFVSHLPHAIAFSLITCVPKNYFRFAASGLKDTTRIAASDSVIWEDIFLSNQKNILKTIETFEAQLSALKSALKAKDKPELHKILKLAKTKRETLG